MSDHRSLDREIFSLAVPALATLVAEPLLLLADTTILGHLGTAQLAGLTMASSVVGVIVGLSIFLAYGTTATVGRLLGTGDRRGAIAGGIDGMALGLITGIAVCAGLIVAAPAVVGTVHADPLAAGYAVTYLRVVALGLPAQLVMLAATGILRGLQDTTTPLVVVVTVNLLNIVANVALVFGAGLGVAGSAAGTAGSQWLGCVVMTSILLRRARREGATLGFRPGRVVRAAGAGAWLVVRSASVQLAIVATTVTAAGMGRESLAGHQIVNALWMTTGFALDAFAIAAQAMIAVRLGAGDRHGTRVVMRRITWWSVGFGTVVGVCLALLSPFLGAVFTPDPTVQHLLTGALRVLGLLAPLGGFTFILDGILIGAGDVRYLAVAGLVATAVYLPCAWWVHRAGLGLAALWGAYGVWIAARGITLHLRARGDHWMRLGA